MPDGTPTPAPGQSQPATPPFGTTSAVSPTPNRGHEAAGLQALGVAVQQLQKIVPLVQPGSDIGQAVLDSIKKLAKFVPAGSVTPASQRNQLEQMAMRQGQENQQLAALKQMQQPQQQMQQAQQAQKAA